MPDLRRTEFVGRVHGRYSNRDHELRRRVQCRYAFIADPWTDLASIYDERYYAGVGANPLVDYRFELAAPAQTTQLYEWRGITCLV